MGSCKKDISLWEIQNLNSNTITVLGHGGSGIHSRFPMNSKQSILEALNSGAAGSEMDVHVTKDSVLVFYHNNNLEDETNCSGQIINLNWTDIENCRYKLPLLDPAALINANELFDKIQNPEQFTFSFDCKLDLEDNDAYLNLFATALTKHIKKYKIASTCFVESTNSDFLELMLLKDSSLRLLVYTSNYTSGLDVSKKIKIFGLSIDSEKISKEEIQEAHLNHLQVSLFNLKSENDNLSAIEKNPDYMQTDKLEFLIEALQE